MNPTTNIKFFLPYPYTYYSNENSNIQKYLCFAEALKILHKDIKTNKYDFKVKRLKTREIIELSEETKERLGANEKDSTTETNDVFTKFITTIKEGNITEARNYLSYVNNRYIPNKEEFIEELKTSFNRTKNDGPLRNKFFLNIFRRFKDLELKIEDNKKNKQLTIEPTPNFERY